MRACATQVLEFVILLVSGRFDIRGQGLFNVCCLTIHVCIILVTSVYMTKCQFQIVSFSYVVNRNG